jgi:hypothetical protein
VFLERVLVGEEKIFMCARVECMYECTSEGECIS